MVQFNWEEIWNTPFAFTKIVAVVSWRVLRLSVSRWINIGQPPPKTNFEIAAKAILLFTVNSTNYKYILSAPSSAEESTPMLQTADFAAYVVTGTKSLRDADAVLLFFHGGGYSIGHPLQYRGTYQRWIRTAKSEELNLSIVALKYPLTPQNKYPAQLNAAVAAYQHLTKVSSIESSKIFIAGDSAGGNLAAALLLKIRDSPEMATPGGAVLLSPWIDLTLSKSSHSIFLDVDIIVNPKYMKDHLVKMLVGSEYQPNDPRLSPALSPDLKGLPPQLVLYGTAEVLQEDSKMWLKQCAEDGVIVEGYVGQGGLHCFGLGGLASDKRLERESNQVILAFLQRSCGPLRQ